MLPWQPQEQWHSEVAANITCTRTCSDATDPQSCVKPIYVYTICVHSNQGKTLEDQLSVVHNLNCLAFLLTQTHPNTTGNESALIKMANNLVTYESA